MIKYTDWDPFLEREVEYYEFDPDTTPTKNYRVDQWAYRYGWTSHPEGEFFETLEDAVEKAKLLKAAGQMSRVVILKEET